MKEYRLLAWPDLPGEFKRTAHRRVLSDMSLRFMTLAQLGGVSGLKKSELRDLMSLLDSRGVLGQRDCIAATLPGATGRATGLVAPQHHVLISRDGSTGLSGFPWRD